MAPICFFSSLFLWDCAPDKRPSGNGQLYWILHDGDAQDSRSFGAILCSYLGTFRPLLLCCARSSMAGAIKPIKRFKRSEMTFIFKPKPLTNLVKQTNKPTNNHVKPTTLNPTTVYSLLARVFPQQQLKERRFLLATLQFPLITSEWRHCSITSSHRIN